MKNYEKPELEMLSFQETEALMLDELTLEGTIGYSLRANTQSL